MAVTKFQQDYWGNQFDSIPAPVNSDIPYGTGVNIKTTPDFKQGIDRDTYIRLMSERNPNVDARTPQARKIEGALMNRGGSSSGDGSFLSYATAPFLAPIKGAIGMAADSYVDSEVEDQYFRETGERLPAKQIYQIMEDKNQSDSTRQDIGVEKTEEQLREGAEPVGDPLVSPSGTLATMNKNIISGVGTSTGSVSQPTLPKPPDPKQVEKKAFSDYGKSVSFDQNKIPEWYNSHSFSAGLVSFGLNLLSGNDLATSFNAASNLFMNAYGEEKRGIWAQDLAAQGFDATEIEQWIRTGDSKVLTKPEEKRMKQIQMETSLAQLDNLQYNNSPEMRQYNLDRQNTMDNLKITQAQNQMDIARQNLGLQRARLSLEREKAQAKLQNDPTFGLDPKTLRLVQNQFMPYMRDAQVKASRFDQSVSAARKALEMWDSGEKGQATSLYKGSREAFTKGYKGGYGGINASEIDTHSGDPNWFKRRLSDLDVAITGTVSRDELVRQLEAAEYASKSEHNALENYIKAQYKSLAAEVGPIRAQQILNLTGSGSGIGQVVGSEANEDTVEFF
ncbi:virion structural protein [Proteus phage J3S]